MIPIIIGEVVAVLKKEISIFNFYSMDKLQEQQKTFGVGFDKSYAPIELSQI